MVYYLKLPHWMKQLHPVFNVVKLTPAPEDPITGWRAEDHPLPIVINGEAEWEVEEILGSPPLKSLHQNSQRSSIANTWGLRDTSNTRSLTISFIQSPLLQDIAILKGG